MNTDTGRTKTGYLFKKGRGLNLAIFKPWAYRWFSLDKDSGILKYYEEIDGRRILKGEVDVSVGQVIEHEHQISGRGNCMEILCRRINRNESMNKSSTMEVLMLSAVYKSQLTEWKQAFLSVKDKAPMEQRDETPAAEIDESYQNLRAAQVNTAHSALKHIKLLNNSIMSEAIPSDGSNVYESAVQNQEHSEENFPQGTNIQEKPSVSIATSEVPAKENMPEAEVCDEFSRVLDLDDFLGDAENDALSSEVTDLNPEESTHLPVEPSVSNKLTSKKAESKQIESPISNSLPIRSKSWIKDGSDISETGPSLRRTSWDPIRSADSDPFREIRSQSHLPIRKFEMPTKEVENSGTSRNSEDEDRTLLSSHGVINNEKIGYLFKRGRGRSLSFLKPWSYRWCILNVLSGKFTYYVEENGIRVWKGALSVVNGTIFELDGKLVGRQFAFDVSCVNDCDDHVKGGIQISETITFAALYKSEMEDWLFAFSLIPGCEVIRLDGSSIMYDIFSEETKKNGSKDEAISVTDSLGEESSPHLGIIQDAIDSKEASASTFEISEKVEYYNPGHSGAREKISPLSNVNSKSCSTNGDKIFSVTEDDETVPTNLDVTEGGSARGKISTEDLLAERFENVVEVNSVIRNESSGNIRTTPFPQKDSLESMQYILEKEDFPIQGVNVESDIFSSEFPLENTESIDEFFAPEALEIDGDSNSWVMASGQALTDILSEENDLLQKELVSCKEQLEAKSKECDALRLEIAHMSSRYHEELNDSEEMMEAQIAASTELVSELQSKLYMAQEKLNKFESTVTDENNRKNSNRDAFLEPSNKEDNLVMEKELQKCVIQLMSSDTEESLPLLPAKLWERPDLLTSSIESVLSADALKKPLIFLQNSAENSVGYGSTSGKTTLAALICRSQPVREQFEDRIFWLNVGNYEKYYASYEKRRDYDHCALLEILAEKIRKRMCPWLVRKMKKSSMTYRDWRMYISDLLYSRHCVNDLSLDCDKFSGEDRTLNIPTVPSCLLVLDDVRDSSIISSLGFLNIVTIVTTRRSYRFDKIGIKISVPSPTTSELQRKMSGEIDTSNVKMPKADSFASCTISSRSQSFNSSLEDKEPLNCALKSSICRYAVPQKSSSDIVETNVLAWTADSALKSSQSSKISKNLSSPFINLPQEDQYRLIALSCLPSEVVYPYAMAAGMWKLDIQVARNYLYNLFVKSWVSLYSPGDGFSVHPLCTSFLSSQLERLPLLSRKNLKEKTIEGLVAWITSSDAFSAELLRHSYDWSYILLWSHLDSPDLIGKYQEQFVLTIRNMKYLTLQDRLHALYYIDYAASLVLRLPIELEDSKSWCEDWIRKSLQLKMEAMSDNSISSDLYVFREIFPVLLDCNSRNLIYADAISYLQHISSHQKALESRKSVSGFFSSELLAFQGSFHAAAGRNHRATEMFKDAAVTLRNHLISTASGSYLDSLLLIQVLLKLKQISSSMNHSVDWGSTEYENVNELLDEIMTARKLTLGCDEHPRLTDIIQLSGEVWSRTGGGEVMSRKLFKAGLMMRCIQQGEYHPLSINMFEDMALSLEIVNKPLSSLPYFEKAVELSQYVYGNHSPMCILYTISYCCTLKGLSREDEAVLIIKKMLVKVRQLQIIKEESGKIDDIDHSYSTNDNRNLSVCYYGLLVLTYAHVSMSTSLASLKEEIPKARKLLLELLKVMHGRKLGNTIEVNEFDEAIAASVLFKLGAMGEDTGDFVRAKKFYSGASTAFAEVGDMYHLCSILSLIRLSACEVNLGELEESRLLLQAACEALDDVILNGSPDTFPGVSKHGVFTTVDLSIKSRFYCILFRIMEWLGLVLPTAAEDMKSAVDKLLQVATG